MRTVARNTVAAGLVGLALGTTAALAQAPSAVLLETIQDVGVVQRGDEIRVAFPLRNDGDRPLDLTEIKPNCGCIVTDYTQSIGPGETGRVDVTVETENLRGPISKTVQVFTNDARNPRLHLIIRADIRSYVGVEPGYARFMAIQGESSDPAPQTVWSETQGDFAILSARSPYRHVNVSFREATDAERVADGAGKQWRVEIDLAGDSPPGSMADYVVLETNHPRQREVKIPVSGLIRPVVTVLPRVADFGSKSLEGPYTAVLEVENLGEDAVQFGTIRSDLPGVEAELEAVEEGRKYKLRVTLTPQMAKGPFVGNLLIESSSGLQPVVQVALRGTIL